MPSRKKEVEKEIETIHLILVFARECFQYCYYFFNPNTVEEEDYLKRSDDFDFLKHVLWRMTIIELSKLFCNSADRDKFNLYHFTNKFRKDGHYSEFSISEEKLKEWENKLEIARLSIENLLKIRDKVYAHTDKIKIDVNTWGLTTKEVEKLIDIAEDVIKEIYLTVIGADVSMDTVIFSREHFEVIKILADARRKDIENTFKQV